MKQISTKQRKLIREAHAVRVQLAEEWPTCMVCRRLATDTHEISCGPARSKSLGERAALLRLCRRCHQWVQGEWSVQEQLALKGLRDPEHYDRVAVNRLRGRADDAVTEREVWLAVRNVLARVR